MQPGRPQGFAAGDPLMFGLPGNPVSAAVSFEVFVRPALLAMQGRTQIDRRMLRLPAADRLAVAARAAAVPARSCSSTARSPRRPSSGSHRAGGLARAEGYAVVPAEVDGRRRRRHRRCHARLVSDARADDLGAILLAGGRGSRMGGVHKPLLEVGGTTLLDAALGAAHDAGCDPIVVVGPPDDAHADLTWVREDPPFGGPAAAIVAALPARHRTADARPGVRPAARRRRRPRAPRAPPTTADGVCLEDADGPPSVAHRHLPHRCAPRGGGDDPGCRSQRLGARACSAASRSPRSRHPMPSLSTSTRGTI